MRKDMCTVKKRPAVNIFDLLGILMFTAALVLVCCNLAVDYYGCVRAARNAEQLELDIGPTLRGRVSEPAAGFADGRNGDGADLPDYVLNPDMSMPETESDGHKYIGLLRIDALSLELPVISRWSYEAFRTAPARYSGSLYSDNMVIAAHNYSGHFGRLKELRTGDTVSFTDMHGNVFAYEVSETDILKPSEVEAMVSGDWDLTLFTCTEDGSARVTVRCKKV